MADQRGQRSDIGVARCEATVLVSLESAHETEKIVRLGLPRIIRRKEMLQNSIAARFTAKRVLEDQLLRDGG
jgi:hypothetical protein